MHSLIHSGLYTSLYVIITSNGLHIIYTHSPFTVSGNGSVRVSRTGSGPLVGMHKMSRSETPIACGSYVSDPNSRHQLFKETAIIVETAGALQMVS